MPWGVEELGGDWLSVHRLKYRPSNWNVQWPLSHEGQFLAHSDVCRFGVQTLKLDTLSSPRRRSAQMMGPREPDHRELEITDSTTQGYPIRKSRLTPSSQTEMCPKSALPSTRARTRTPPTARRSHAGFGLATRVMRLTILSQ